MHEDEERTLGTPKAHRKIIDELIVAANGQVFDTAGDSVLAEFPSVVEAYHCAVAVQDAVPSLLAQRRPTCVGPVHLHRAARAVERLVAVPGILGAAGEALYARRPDYDGGAAIAVTGKSAARARRRPEASVTVPEKLGPEQNRLSTPNIRSRDASTAEKSI